jgi:hypothetical protein
VLAGRIEGERCSAQEARRTTRLRQYAWKKEPSCNSVRSVGSARIISTEDAPRASQRLRKAERVEMGSGSPQLSSTSE